MAHGFNSVEFFVVFVALVIVTGTFVPITLIWLTAVTISFLIRNFITERRLPIPRNAAVFITGCSTGIGKDAALTLSREGFTVFATVRSKDHKEALEKEAQLSRLIPVICDITNTSDLEQACAEVTKELEARDLYLSAVINNAGISNSQVIELMPSDDFAKQFNVNVFAQVEVAKTFLPLLRDRSRARGPNLPSSRLVFNSSGSGQVSPPTIAPYAASKHALEAVVDGLRVELQPFGIDVVSVAPGKIDTGFHSAAEAHSNTIFTKAKSTVSNAVAQVYAKMFKDVSEAHKNLQGAKVSKVTDAFRYALLAKRPPTRIPVGLDMLAVSVIIMLPDRIRDMILGWHKKPE